jgi:hypothetical protein
MKSNRTRLFLGLALLGSTIEGCGCGSNRQVIVQERRGAPIQVDTRDGVRVKAPFVDVRVPGRRPAAAGQIDVPALDPE